MMHGQKTSNFPKCLLFAKYKFSKADSVLCLFKLQNMNDLVLFILKSFGWFDFIPYVQCRATWTLRRTISTMSERPTVHEAGG